MPYIEKKYRAEIDDLIEKLANKINELSQNDSTVWPGILNYAVTKLILKIIGDLRYWKIAIITGVLENIKEEFYRRKVAPYEDIKKEKEGDVF